MVPGELLAHLYKFGQGVLSDSAVKFYPCVKFSLIQVAASGALYV